MWHQEVFGTRSPTGVIIGIHCTIYNCMPEALPFLVEKRFGFHQLEALVYDEVVGMLKRSDMPLPT